jgi:hypothetical protein
MQTAFADALLARDFDCPPGLRTWNGSDPGRRFAVYRNNVLVALVDALADTYPVVQALVGVDFFRAMAQEFVRGQPPTSPVLAGYGAGFAAFIEGFAPAAGLPYLPDLARLEWMRVEVYHAADVAPLRVEEIAPRLADADLQPPAVLDLHPAARVLCSRHAVASLWAAHQADDVDAALAQVDPAVAEVALVLRSGLDVLVMRIGDAP